MKHKKPLVAILLCIMLIVSMFALVACGEANDDQDGKQPSAGKYDGLLDNAIGYMLENQMTGYINVTYVKDNDHGLTLHMPDENVFSIDIRDNSESNGNTLTIYHFETNERAENAFETMKNQNFDGMPRKVIDNLIVFEGRVGNYDKFLNAQLPKDAIPTKIINFIKYSLNQNYESIDVAYVAFLIDNEHDFGFNFMYLADSDEYLESNYTIVSEKYIDPSDNDSSINMDRYSSDSYYNKLDDGYYYTELKAKT